VDTVARKRQLGGSHGLDGAERVALDARDLQSPTQLTNELQLSIPHKKKLGVQR
jgi:hypothetical protein